MLNRFFKAYPEFTLVCLAIFLVAAIVAFYLWGIGDLFKNLNKATVIGSESTAVETTFDLEGARSLNIEGLPP